MTEVLRRFGVYTCGTLATGDCQAFIEECKRYVPITTRPPTAPPTAEPITPVQANVWTSFKVGMGYTAHPVHGEEVSRESRRAVARMLYKLRGRAGKTRAEMAEALVWPIAFYLKAEAGTVSLSDGEANDVRRFGAELIRAAGVRDELRRRGPSRIRRL